MKCTKLFFKKKMNELINRTVLGLILKAGTHTPNKNSVYTEVASRVHRVIWTFITRFRN